MANPSPLLEPSLLDALLAVERADDLPEQTRRHWACSMRRLALALDKPPEVIPARWTAIRIAVDRLHHARVGTTWKTLANHRSNLRAALAWFRNEHAVPARGAPLTPAWDLLRGQLTHLRHRANLYALMRYCSARGIVPEEVDEGVIDAYMAYRAETTALTSDGAARRKIARTWNACIEAVEGWPSRRLMEPPVLINDGPGWDDFPEGLRKGIDRYLDGLRQPQRGGPRRRRLRPCKPSTIRTRRAELLAAAKMAVRLGVPIGELTSLGALLNPDLAEKILDAYWRKDGDDPKVFTIDLASKFVFVARQTGCLDEQAIERLEDMRADLELHRRGGLTEKNRSVVREVLSEGVWDEVVNLPWAMMARSRSLQEQAPVKAATIAQLAAAIAILTVAPVRPGNLSTTVIGENLIKPGGPQSNYWLVFPDHDVKNRIPLEFPFGDALTELIDEYVQNFRPTLVRGSNEPWLFPGEARGCKKTTTLSAQITERVQKATGVRITVHQFRHAAAALILRAHPGNYELVRRVLGHRNIQTTISFYCGLENTQATEIFADIVAQHMTFEPEEDRLTRRRFGLGSRSTRRPEVDGP
jgi:hypothetical protein